MGIQCTGRCRAECIRVSRYDFDTWLTDDTTGDSVAGTVFGDTLRASYETDPLVEGPHTLVVSNRGAILFSRTVTVLAEIRWEQPIPAAD